MREYCEFFLMYAWSSFLFHVCFLTFFGIFAYLTKMFNHLGD